jgi:hypothetical protein
MTGETTSPPSRLSLQDCQVSSREYRAFDDTLAVLVFCTGYCHPRKANETARLQFLIAIDVVILTRQSALERTCAPGGTRTPNLLIRSQMLYPLSYGRVVA